MTLNLVGIRHGHDDGQYGHITDNFHRSENGMAKGTPDDIDAGQQHHTYQATCTDYFHFIQNPLDDVPEKIHAYKPNPDPPKAEEEKCLITKGRKHERNVQFRAFQLSCLRVNNIFS